jgi:hypothetical protein
MCARRPEKAHQEFEKFSGGWRQPASFFQQVITD